MPNYQSTHTGAQVDQAVNQALLLGYAVDQRTTNAAAVTANLTNTATYSYTLAAGSRITVKFVKAVPANATLNVQSTGAKAIYFNGAAIIANIINAGDAVEFVYDGTNYIVVGTPAGYTASCITTALNGAY